MDPTASDAGLPIAGYAASWLAAHDRARPAFTAAAAVLFAGAPAALVTFAGNSVTDRDTVERYLLFRAAELTVQNGGDYFVFADREVDKKTRTYTTPGIGGFGGGFRGALDYALGKQGGNACEIIGGTMTGQTPRDLSTEFGLSRAARPGEVFDSAGLQQVVQRRAPIYDKKQDGHYNLISALHKSVRGSDPDAALYYLARMLDAGEDPLYLARRIVRMAIEDIGLADPQALVIANAAKDAYDFLGSPEGELAIAQAVIYVATAPKSNAGYVAYGAAKRAAKDNGSLLPPKHILNAPTRLMQDEGYGRGYAYDHDQEEAFSGQDYFPDEMERQQFYDPPERGFEREIRKRLEYWAKLRRERGKP